MKRRVAAVVLPGFRVALVRARSPDVAPRDPLAVVVSADRTEHSISGGTRIDEVSDEARALGVLPGATIASAKAKCSDLRVRVLAPVEATRALEGLAETLLQLGAITSPLLDRDAVVVDVTGCAHLHSTEEKLLEAIVKMVGRAGFACHAAVASGPEIAWALAWSGGSSIFGGVVREEDTLHALGPLPIDVLRLDADTTSYFYRLGVRTIDRLRALPRAALTARLDTSASRRPAFGGSVDANLLARVCALLDGDDRTPIARHPTVQVIEERAELEYGIEHHEALFFVLRPLCERLSARLEGRCARAARIEVVLELDRALCTPDQRIVSVSLPLASPVRASGELHAVLRSRFEREPPLVAPALAVVLRAPELASVEERTRDLFVPESRAELALPKLAAELSALIGDAFGTLAIRDDWRLDHRSTLVPFGGRGIRASYNDIEPLRVIPARACDHFIELHHLARYEHLVWWRERRDVFDWKLVWSSINDTGAIAFVEERPDGRTVRGFWD
jgi:protein ImuB